MQTEKNIPKNDSIEYKIWNSSIIGILLLLFDLWFGLFV